MQGKLDLTNISIDLIYGLPDQTTRTMARHIAKSNRLRTYRITRDTRLIVEPKTVFYNLMNKGKLPLPGEDLETEMFDMLIEHMEKQRSNAI